MIVDLERNDLGRVCSYDSVRVSALRELEEYRTVFQTTATVCGRLHKDKDRIDLLRASFPGGSITGCPKIRAMEIIEELEPTRRSIYTGSLGYLSFSGDMDFNILIRTILKKQDKLYFGVGGGIVADSKPEEEYEETLVKAGAMIEAIS
jgi:para-aminobenzoate synthetase component 1